MTPAISIRLLSLVLLTLSALLWAQSGRAAPPLPPLAAEQESVTVSGLSSGGFMATQVHVAFSEGIAGAGVVAGGPYYCAGEQPLVPNLVRAQTACMNPCRWLPSWLQWACGDYAFPDGEALAAKASDLAAEGEIDDLSHLRGDRVYLFSGRRDRTVVPRVVAEAEAFYLAAGLPPEALRYDADLDAGHGYITDDGDDAPCPSTAPPFINNCHYHQARVLLEHLYGPLNAPVEQPAGTVLSFDQAAFVDPGDYQRSSLADTGYLFLPDGCRSGGCRLHVVFHGCRQSAAEVTATQERFYRQAGYNEVADSNRLMILYPQLRDRSQTQVSPTNPRGCWDFWGYSGAAFHTQQAVQMRAVMAMISQLQQPIQQNADPGRAKKN